ncbi:MAG: hypothetical protein IVW57_04270 [Ktedonobacterales bacterium]|nr:hypothetical protein [Ktedonobacterales bacterium]
MDHRPTPPAWPTAVAPKMTFKRAACGILWTLYTLLLAFNVSRLTEGPVDSTTVVFAVLAFLCGWYAYRIWTFQARRLVFFIIF